MSAYSEWAALLAATKKGALDANTLFSQVLQNAPKCILFRSSEVSLSEISANDYQRAGITAGYVDSEGGINIPSGTYTPEEARALGRWLMDLTEEKDAPLPAEAVKAPARRVSLPDDPA